MAHYLFTLDNTFCQVQKQISRTHKRRKKSHPLKQAQIRRLKLYNDSLHTLK